MAYTDEAVETAVYTSSRYIPDRFLPDKAIDLIDEAGARVKLRQTTLPADLADIQKRIKFIVHRMENARSRTTESSAGAGEGVDSIRR